MQRVQPSKVIMTIFILEIFNSDEWRKILSDTGLGKGKWSEDIVTVTEDWPIPIFSQAKSPFKSYPKKYTFFVSLVNCSFQKHYHMDLHSMGELVLGMGDFNGHVGKWTESYEGVHGGNGIWERNVEGKMLEFCDKKELCVANTWRFKKEEKRKVT